MTGWELFTWINVVVLGLGSVIVFVMFLRDVEIGIVHHAQFSLSLLDQG